MHRKQSKRTRRIRLALVYMLMTLTVIVSVGIATLIVLGYMVDNNKGVIERGGLLQFGSQPGGALVTLDNVSLGMRTANKMQVHPGSHTVLYARDGYRPWQKTVNVKPGQVVWLTYPRLIPTDLKVETLQTFPRLGSVHTSQSGARIALMPEAGVLGMMIADVRDDTPRYTTLDLSTLAVTKSSPEQSSHFEIDSWSQNEQYILVRHMYDGSKLEWLLIDRDRPDRSLNLTAAFDVLADTMIFAAGNGKELFMKAEGVVRRIDIEDQTLSKPLVSHVKEFFAYSRDMLIVVQQPTPEEPRRVLGYWKDGFDAVQPLTHFAEDGQPVKLALAEYYDKWYVAATHGINMTIMSGDLPEPGRTSAMIKLVDVPLAAPVTQLRASSNGRFLVAQTASGFTTYDIDFMKASSTKIDTMTATSRQLRWLDQYMIWTDGGGMLRTYEFDGANQQPLHAVAEGFDVALSPRGKYIYSVGKSADGLTLQRVQLLEIN